MTELEYAEMRMQQKWYDLVMAEQKGATIAVLERLYNLYMLAVEEYNRHKEASQPSHVPVMQKWVPKAESPKQKKKAS